MNGVQLSGQWLLAGNAQCFRLVAGRVGNSACGENAVFGFFFVQQADIEETGGVFVFVIIIVVNFFNFLAQALLLSARVQPDTPAAAAAQTG